jgi:hypothetical protein
MQGGDGGQNPAVHGAHRQAGENEKYALAPKEITEYEPNPTEGKGDGMP